MASRHARLHKRANSASSVAALSPVADQGAFTFNRSETPKVTYEESPMTMTVPAAHNKIKPYLRKLHSKDANALDLSRPAEENERLAGLGIQEYGGYPPSVADVNFAPVNNRNRHHARSTSNTSQFSTSSSLQRPTAPYMPPIRQTPQPYSPPISKSTPPSVLGSETDVDNIMTDEEYRLRQHAYDSSRRSGSISSSTPGGPPALRIHTTGSSTRLAGSYSQSSVSLSSPIAQSRARGDTLRSFETTTSPSSRTSFDKAFGFVRGGRDSPADPASQAANRAANIRAAREAFQAKEEAEREREMRKQHKKIEHQRRKSDTQNHKRSRSVSDSNEKTSRPSIGGRQYSDHREAHVRALPVYTPPSNSEKPSGFHPKNTKAREAKGTWAKFVAWFKTRLLRIKRTMHR